MQASAERHRMCRWLAEGNAMRTWNMVVAPVSGNSKTGPIPTISLGPDTCPTTCPFLDNGCYGAGRLWGTTTKNLKPYSRESLLARLQGARRDAALLRDRVLGDLRKPGGGVDYEYLRDVAWACAQTGLRPFGFTHVPVEELDPALVPDNYTLNISCETPEQVWVAIDRGFDAVIANDRIEDGTMILGKRVVTCPAQTRDGVTCATCGLCAKKGRKAIIRFLLHGPQVRKARAAVDAVDLG